MSILIFCFSSHILVIWVSFFYFVVQLGVYQFYCISKNKFLCFVNFSNVSFVSISLILALILIISCLLLFLVLISSFPRAFRCNVVIYLLTFYSLINNSMQQFFPLVLHSQCTRNSGMLYQCSHLPLSISSLLSSTIHSSFHCVLVSMC